MIDEKIEAYYYIAIALKMFIVSISDYFGQASLFNVCIVHTHECKNYFMKILALSLYSKIKELIEKEFNQIENTNLLICNTVGLFS